MAMKLSKMSAYSSGMRGGEKPKHAGGGESKQGEGTKVGDPDGVGLDAYSSGMRGPEKPKQKGAEVATMSPTGNGGESKQAASTVVGNPKGHDTSQSVGKSLQPSAAQASAKDAHSMDENSLETSTASAYPEAEEDDTHINVRIPKASMKRKTGGLAT